MLELAALIDVAAGIGYPLLVALIMFESAGVPVPGETALITAAVAASRGHLEIEVVLALAASAAIIGDNLGYIVARRVGRPLLERDGLFANHRRKVLEIGEPFFERHGAKAVFFGRWILGLRVWASWLAGATRMPWPSFLLFNALGGCAWACTVGMLAYALGHQIENLVVVFGAVALVLTGVAVATHVRRGRRAPEPAPQSST